MAEARKGEVTFKGNPIELVGPRLKPGDSAPDFTCVGAGLSVASMAVKSHAANVPLLSGPIRKLILTFSPAMLVGAVLTGVFIEQNLYALLPGAWLLLYGAAVVSAGTNSVRIVPVMGAAFMALGAATFVVPYALIRRGVLDGF